MAPSVSSACNNALYAGRNGRVGCSAAAAVTVVRSTAGQSHDRLATMTPLRSSTGDGLIRQFRLGAAGGRIEAYANRYWPRPTLLISPESTSFLAKADALLLSIPIDLAISDSR